ncbi:AbrB/MazE/SpoVT family DNA-binding domain-containing protein [Burkholderia plantarii]|nr:AbrB/MazE/SpoVT family DNA-binding domain-containing protein [Burkholderia plantarii]
MSTMTMKDRVTIPKAVRERLGLEPGMAVEFVMGGAGRVTERKAAARRRCRVSRRCAARSMRRCPPTRSSRSRAVTMHDPHRCQRAARSRHRRSALG